MKVTVRAPKKLVQERKFARASLSARAIALNYLDLHLRSHICVSEIQSFLLPKHFKCLIQEKT